VLGPHLSQRIDPETLGRQDRLRRGRALVAGDHRQLWPFVVVHRRRADHFGQRSPTDQQVEKTRLLVQSEKRGHLALWVRVNDQHRSPAQAQRVAQVHGGRGLADSAFLVGNGQDGGDGSGPD
jgi:hypothetical protein